MNKTILATALALAGAAGFSGSAAAAQISLLNVDPAGVGLNDTTPATKQGSNPGRTVGEQRRIAYQFAMDMWGAVLESEVEIKIYASFAPLTCTPTTGVLGQAGANWLYLLTEAETTRIYPAALADALVGEDLSVLLGDDPNDPADISSQFNGDLGKPGCLPGSQWYYGIDGKTPAGSINFLNVVMHEIGHGLGVQGFLNKTSGALLAGYSDSYTRHAYDNVLDLGFEQMDDAQRATAMKTPGRTVWSGANTTAQAALILDNNRPTLLVTAPIESVGNYEIGGAAFGPAASPSNFAANQMVVVDDGVGTLSDGCETPFVNAAAVAGKLAVIDRGTCGFAVKVKNAQLNGAVGVVMANNAGGVLDMGGADATITIPSVMVSIDDGARIKAGAGLATGSVVVDPTLLRGADNAGRVRLYAPTVVAGGSTFSHVDTASQPNGLMEPFDTPEIQSQFNVDVTPAIFADVGWQLNPGGAKIGKCDTTVDAVADGGLVIGANVAAWSSMCATQAAGNKLLYTRCIATRADQMRQQRLITSSQFNQVFKCAAFKRP